MSIYDMTAEKLNAGDLGLKNRPALKEQQARTALDFDEDVFFCLAQCAQLVQDCAFAVATTKDPGFVSQLIRLAADLDRLSSCND